MSQKLPVDGFKWEKKMLKFKEDFIKNSDKGYIFEVDFEYPKIYMISVVIYHFYQK